MANNFTANLNLAIPSSGDLNWENEYSDLNEAVDDIGNLLSFTITVLDPALNGMIFYEGFFPQENIVVNGLGFYAQTAPTGANLEIDIIKNGVAQNNVGVLTDGNQFEKTIFGSPVGFSTVDRLGLKFIQVGSVTAGDKIIVTVYYQKEAIASS
jgi:hypothetical protein